MKNIDDMNCHIEFGKFIKYKREELKLLQLEVAEKAEITQSYLSYIERGERTIDIALAIRICKILKLDMTEFINKYM